jgi:hypothetical protein
MRIHTYFDPGDGFQSQREKGLKTASKNILESPLRRAGRAKGIERNQNLQKKLFDQEGLAGVT